MYLVSPSHGVPGLTELLPHRAQGGFIHHINKLSRITAVGCLSLKHWRKHKSSMSNESFCFVNILHDGTNGAEEKENTSLSHLASAASVVW